MLRNSNSFDVMSNEKSLTKEEKVFIEEVFYYIILF